jgi:tetratricopeptide (TPR) repeat protein
MTVLRLLGKGLQNAADSGRALHSEQHDLIAQRNLRAAGTTSALDYAALGWAAEQNGELQQAFAVYELLANRGNAPSWVAQRLAAVAVSLGRLPDAIHAYETLVINEPRDAMTLQALGHLLMLAGRNAEACDVLGHCVDVIEHEEGGYMVEQADALLECLEAPADVPAKAQQPGVDRVQTLTRRGLSYLTRGRFVRATQLFEDAMGLVDSLLVTHGEWLLAQSKAEDGNLPAHLAETVISLAQLSDLLLQYLARTKLASNLAEALREKQLRHDLASWATGCQEVQNLLQIERSRLGQLSAQHPNHAELQYRLGLCSRASGHLEDAVRAFGRTLAIEAHHAACGVRLAATLLQLHRADQVLPVLERTFALDQCEAERYYALGVASTDAAKFDRAVNGLARDLGLKFDQQDVKANLALALGMLGIKDSQKDAWRHPQPCAAQAGG